MPTATHRTKPDRDGDFCTVGYVASGDFRVGVGNALDGAACNLTPEDIPGLVRALAVLLDDAPGARVDLARHLVRNTGHGVAHADDLRAAADALDSGSLFGAPGAPRLRAAADDSTGGA